MRTRYQEERKLKLNLDEEEDAFKSRIQSEIQRCADEKSRNRKPSEKLERRPRKQRSDGEKRRLPRGRGRERKRETERARSTRKARRKAI